MLDDPDGYAGVAVRIRFVSYHCSLNGGSFVFALSFQKPYENSHRRTKLHAHVRCSKGVLEGSLKSINSAVSDYEVVTN